MASDPTADPSVATSHPLAGASPPAALPQSVVDEIELQQILLHLVDRAERQVSVRELVLAASTQRRVTYKQVKSAAESLAAQGRLLRRKAGTANLYQRNNDADTRTAHDIAALLATSSDPTSVISKALTLLREAIPPSPYQPTEANE